MEEVSSIRLCFARWSLILSSLFICHTSYAHEIRPAYLEITQTDQYEYTVLWKVPVSNGRRPEIRPICHVVVSSRVLSEESLSDASLTKFIWRTDISLAGQNIDIEGLQLTLMDVLIHVEFLDGIVYTFLAQADAPTVFIPIEPNKWNVLQTYTNLGIEHILKGFDHLLFVLCLLLLIDSRRLLVTTITSFTIAHSITLALSALEIVRLPSAPVEAVIALSIMFLAREFILKSKGRTSLTVRYPWLVAFIFGLLHGLGFAGALQEIGLPQSEIAFALIFFNVGVEIGQLFFIPLAFAINLIIAKILKRQNVIIRTGMAFAVGGVSSFWLIDRLLQF